MNGSNKEGSESKFLNVSSINESVQQRAEIEEKLDQLVELLNQTEIPASKAYNYLLKLSKALNTTIDKTGRKGNGFSLVLTSANNLFLHWVKAGTKVLIGLLLIVLGFSLIIIPAPFPAFEIATIFYFTDQDGVTVMDLIALLIIFCGVNVVISVLLKINK